MSEKHLDVLRSAFKSPYSIECQRANRFLFDSGESGSAPSSFATASWDRYFRDLSFGSYTPLERDSKRVARSRTWHFGFKNLSLVRRILEMQENGEDAFVLDLGCATGFLRRFIEGNVPNESDNPVYYWGVDVRRDVLESAVGGYSLLQSGGVGTRVPSGFVQHDLASPLPFNSNFFSVVSSFEALKYLHLDTLPEVFAEMARVTANGGIVVVSFPTAFEYYREHRPNHAISLAPNEIIDVIENANLTVESVFGSQAYTDALLSGMGEEGRDWFYRLAEYHPPEIVTAMLAPMYPRYCTQLTYVARRVSGD